MAPPAAYLVGIFLRKGNKSLEEVIVQKEKHTAYLVKREAFCDPVEVLIYTSKVPTVSGRSPC